jgi:hypothetical protein
MIDTSKLMTARAELERAVDKNGAINVYSPAREIWKAKLALDAAITAIKKHRDLTDKAEKYRN